MKQEDLSLFLSSALYTEALEAAHVLPEYPDDWHFPHSKNPQQSYTLLNRESPEFVRFVNPSDYRVVEEACGACHMETIQAAKRSIMASGAMLWGGAAYNNGILPFKNYILGEAYTREGEGSAIAGPPLLDAAAAQKDYGVQPQLAALPAPTLERTQQHRPIVHAWYHIHAYGELQP